MTTMPTLLRRLPAWVVNGITVTLGLVLVQCSISFAAGAQAAQTAISAAVCASLADVVTTTDRVAQRVLVAGVASLASGTLFLLARPLDALLVPAAALLVFAAMLLLAWGPKASSVAFATVLALVFSMSLPASLPLTWAHVGWGVAGTAGYWLWAVATAWLLQPAWRRYVIAATATAESRLLAAIARQMAAPADAADPAAIFEAESALADQLQNARDLVFGAAGRGARAGRDTALLLHLIDLRDLALASNPFTAQAGPREAALKARVVAAMADALAAVAAHLRDGTTAPVDAGAEQAIRDALAALERDNGAPDLHSLVHSKLDLLRAIQRLLDPAAAAGMAAAREDLRRYVSPDEWRLAAVAANLHPHTPVFRHALRTGITAGVAYALSRHSPWTPHPQWLILTIAAVMQGNLAQTLLRRNARVLGTLAGCVVVALLTLYPSPAFMAAAFLVAAGIAHAFFGVRYAVTAGAAAVMAVLQAYLAAPAHGFSELERFADTVAGAVLGWAATYAWPIWERKALPGVLRRAATAIRTYAAEGTAPRADAAGAPRFTRQQAYDAIRAAGAIRTRSLAEPEDVRVPLAELTAWLAAAYGLMAILSNLRLALALHARAVATPAVAAALADVAGRIDALLEGDATSAKLDEAAERALATIPHLAPRVRLALDNAARVSLAFARVREAMAAARGKILAVDIGRQRFQCYDETSTIQGVCHASARPRPTIVPARRMEMSATPTQPQAAGPVRSVVVGMAFVGLLFFILGFTTWLNGSLVPFLKLVCGLNNFQALWVTFAFYIAYTVMALPSAAVLRRIGYKNGMTLGLAVMGAGALLFVPAARSARYELFLLALFTLASGMTLMQTAINPYIVCLGPRDSAAMRISIMGLFNKGAGVVVPLVFTSLMLADIDRFSPTALAALDPAAQAAQRALLAQRLVFPYACMAAALFAITVFIHFSSLRDIPPETDADGDAAPAGRAGVLRFPQLVLGAVALFCYVGVEVIAGDTIGLYGQQLNVARFGVLTSYTMVCMVIGYLVGAVAIPRWLSQQRALVLSGLAGVLLTFGVVQGAPDSTGIAHALLGWSGAPLVPDTVMCLALLGLANAMVWPAIWPLALDGLGRHTASGSALLIMAISGGAVLPLTYGHLSDLAGAQSAYWLLLPCYAMILWYAATGHKIRRWRRGGARA